MSVTTAGRVAMACASARKSIRLQHTRAKMAPVATYRGNRIRTGCHRRTATPAWRERERERAHARARGVRSEECRDTCTQECQQHGRTEQCKHRHSGTGTCTAAKAQAQRSTEAQVHRDTRTDAQAQEQRHTRRRMYRSEAGCTGTGTAHWPCALEIDVMCRHHTTMHATASCAVLLCSTTRVVHLMCVRMRPVWHRNVPTCPRHNMPLGQWHRA